MTIEKPLDYLLLLEGDELKDEQLRVSLIDSLNQQLSDVSINIEAIAVRQSVIGYTYTMFHEDAPGTVLDYFHAAYFEKIGAAFVSKELTKEHLELVWKLCN